MDKSKFLRLVKGNFKSVENMLQNKFKAINIGLVSNNVDCGYHSFKINNSIVEVMIKEELLEDDITIDSENKILLDEIHQQLEKDNIKSIVESYNTKF